MSEFMKDSLVNSKPKMALIPPEFKIDLAKLLTLGGYKYNFNNWKLAAEDQVEEYRDALERHLLARDSGEYIDKDTGMPHIICVAFNSMALHYFDHKFKNVNVDEESYITRLKNYKEKKNARDKDRIS